MTQMRWGEETSKDKTEYHAKMIRQAMDIHFKDGYEITSKEGFYHDLAIVLNKLGEVIEDFQEIMQIEHKKARALVGILCHEHFTKRLEQQYQNFNNQQAITLEW